MVPTPHRHTLNSCKHSCCSPNADLPIDRTSCHNTSDTGCCLDWSSLTASHTPYQKANCPHLSLTTKQFHPYPRDTLEKQCIVGYHCHYRSSSLSLNIHNFRPESGIVKFQFIHVSRLPRLPAIPAYLLALCHLA